NGAAKIVAVTQRETRNKKLRRRGMVTPGSDLKPPPNLRAARADHVITALHTQYEFGFYSCGTAKGLRGAGRSTTPKNCPKLATKNSAAITFCTAAFL